MLDSLVDIHCHILPGIDDGPETYEESLKMVAQAVNQGIKAIIATPHYPYGDYYYEKEEVFEKVEILQGKIDQLGLECNIYPGMELYLSYQLIKKLDQDKLIPLKKETRYLLVEFPLRRVSRNYINILHEISIRGYIPIVAHPERYQFILDNPFVVNELLEQQVFFQVNAGSICGNNGKQSKKIAIEYVKQGLVSFIASDGHSSNWRNIQLSKAIAILKGIIKPCEIQKMFIDNVEKLLNNEQINNSIYEFKPSKLNFFKILKKTIGFK